jgi:pimeloyl-ACP methyl ester carboxylesterase
MAIHPTGDPKFDPSFQDPIQKTPQTQFRIKKLGSAILIGLGISLAAASIVVISLASAGIVPIAVAAGVGAACTTVGAIALWRKITPNMPAPLKAFSQFIQSVADSALAAFALVLIFPINLEKYDSKEKSNDIPVLFIHGFLGSSNNWMYHKRRLEEVGRKNIFTINLGNPMLSIKDYGKEVHEAVKKIQESTGKHDLIIVCHSMGGLVAKEFLYHHPVEGVRVRKIITLGTPHAGTKLARLGALIRSRCCKEMRPNSKLTTLLQTKAKQDTSTQYRQIGSKTDCIILPRKSATNADESSTVKNYVLEATGHIGYLFSDTAADITISEVKETENEVLKEAQQSQS